MSNMTFNKENYKIIAIDLDETMLHKSTLSLAVKNALTRLSNENIEIVIATGRSLMSIPKFVRELPFIRYAVTSNGACVYDLKNNKVISENTIDRKLALEIIKATEKRGAVSICYRDVYFVSVKSYIAFLFFSGKIRKELLGDKKMRELRKEYKKSTKLHLSLGKAVRNCTHNPEKIMYRFTSSEKRDKACEALDHLPLEAVSITGLDLEVNAKGVSKALGLRVLCDLLGAQPSELIAAGDSSNDYEMLKFAGYSIVMENAEDKIKSVADVIAPHVANDGLATILEELFKLKKTED